jgi:hypothetical protein
MTLRVIRRPVAAKNRAQVLDSGCVSQLVHMGDGRETTPAIFWRKSLILFVHHV